MEDGMNGGRLSRSKRMKKGMMMMLLIGRKKEREGERERSDESSLSFGHTYTRGQL